MGGGEMIEDVFLDHSTFAPPPTRFEAGTPSIAQAIGLGAACDYLDSLGMARIEEHERQLGTHLYEQVRAEGGRQFSGPEAGACVPWQTHMSFASIVAVR